MYIYTVHACTIFCQFLEPLQSRRAEHEKVRKSLKDSWHKELKRMHDEVDRLRKARTVYIQRHQVKKKTVCFHGAMFIREHINHHGGL